MVAGITTAPSFIAASIISHSGTTLPSISRMRSPRFTPSARSPLAIRFDAGGQFGEGARRRAVADDLQRQAVGVRAARQLGVEPVQRIVEMVELAASGSRACAVA